MTTNMAKSPKITVEGDRYVDRISSLPEDVVECIMNSLSVRDAARTCVLSTRWRYVWANHPLLVLNKRFWDDLPWNKLPGFDYGNFVTQILLYHVGYVRKFSIHVSLAMSSMPHGVIDLWLSSLCRKGLKVLKLENFSSNPYKIPCSVYSSAELIRLNLRFCIIRSGCFTNIQTLHLDNITFDSSVVLTTPLLFALVLYGCRGVLHFDILAPKLQRLVLVKNKGVNLKPFLTCTGIRRLSLSENKYTKDRKSFCLVKLLASWTMISQLEVDPFIFKYLTTGSVPCIPDQLNLRFFSIFHLNLDSERMPWILCILKNSPLLHTLKIQFYVNDLNRTSDDVDESSIFLFRMDKLHTVIMKHFTATPNELLLTKILLRCAPVLEKMLVAEDDKLDPKVQVRILKNLFSLQHAFPKTRIVFGPNPVHP